MAFLFSQILHLQILALLTIERLHSSILSSKYVLQCPVFPLFEIHHSLEFLKPLDRLLRIWTLKTVEAEMLPFEVLLEGMNSALKYCAQNKPWINFLLSVASARSQLYGIPAILTETYEILAILYLGAQLINLRPLGSGSSWWAVNFHKIYSSFKNLGFKHKHKCSSWYH